MHAHYVQHVPFEGLGSIDAWLQAAGYRISHTRLYQTADFPDPAGIDLLIVMGGPMSVNDEDVFGWLALEKRFIRDAIRAGTSVLGICLGAQLIASALGARVYKNTVKEIGWFPVEGVPAQDGLHFAFPACVEVFHWHGEMFDLPPGAVRLARSRGCENQAFQIGESIMGLQFHLETTPAAALELVRHCRNELEPGEYIQTEAEILGVPPEHYRTIHRLMDALLSFLSRPR